MGWANELADLAQLALKLKKSSGITRKQLQQQRLEKFTALKAALDSGGRKDAQQELRNTTSKTLEVACDIQADVKELNGGSTFFGTQRRATHRDGQRCSGEAGCHRCEGGREA